MAARRCIGKPVVHVGPRKPSNSHILGKLGIRFVVSTTNV